MAWELLLTSDIGLLSLFTIGFILVMGWYLGVYVSKHMKSEMQGRATGESPKDLAASK